MVNAAIDFFTRRTKIDECLDQSDSYKKLNGWWLEWTSRLTPTDVVRMAGRALIVAGVLIITGWIAFQLADYADYYGFYEGAGALKLMFFGYALLLLTEIPVKIGAQ